MDLATPAIQMRSEIVSCDDGASELRGIDASIARFLQHGSIRQRGCTPLPGYAPQGLFNVQRVGVGAEVLFFKQYTTPERSLEVLEDSITAIFPSDDVADESFTSVLVPTGGQM